MTPQNAFAPGSPAGGASPISAMQLPPLQLSNTANAKSGDLQSTFGADSSGFSVNYGNGVSQGGGMGQDIKTQLIVAAVVALVALWYKKKF